jgi:hypothetical protein
MCLTAKEKARENTSQYGKNSVSMEKPQWTRKNFNKHGKTSVSMEKTLSQHGKTSVSMENFL